MRNRLPLVVSMLVAACILLVLEWSQQRADGDPGTSGASAQREADLPVAQPANQAPTQVPVANCGYPDVESAVRDGLLGESELETALQARANIVAELRRGDVDAIAGRGP